MPRLRPMKDSTKVKVLFGIFAANQVAWLVITKHGVKEFQKRFDEQHKRYRRLNEFANIIIEVVNRDDPIILSDKAIQDFVFNDRFERIVQDL